uniref:TetR/AcrR family transcriptional regulator n=1 Tax=Microbacterium sp. SORGH_AS_1204 TaxID=3041785 RepID=UPI0035933D58
MPGAGHAPQAEAGHDPRTGTGPARPSATPAPTPAGTARDRAKAERRTALLAAAARLFAERGFDGVTLGDIGEAAGVSGPAVYRHVASKQALLGAILVDVSERLLRGGRAVAASTTADVFADTPSQAARDRRVADNSRSCAHTASAPAPPPHPDALAPNIAGHPVDTSTRADIHDDTPSQATRDRRVADNSRSRARTASAPAPPPHPDALAPNTAGHPRDTSTTADIHDDTPSQTTRDRRVADNSRSRAHTASAPAPPPHPDALAPNIAGHPRDTSTRADIHDDTPSQATRDRRVADNPRSSAHTASLPDGPENPDAVLRALVDFHVAFALAEADVIRVQDRDLDRLSDADRRTVRRLQNAYVTVWTDALATAFPDAETPAERRVRALACFGLINSTPHSVRGVPAARVRPALARMALAALTA